ncbi:mitochondrial inner membrane protease subunit 2 isoform X2 [Hemitrygon akajei]|uniref:mitochondrial inner membrane protease subunit 2 isoform X2 n=1 Tax=Hemitrygon akajei TaxID=2704970 RepID=UPI003BF999D5
MQSQTMSERGDARRSGAGTGEARPRGIMGRGTNFGKRYLKAFVSGFFVAVPVTVTFLDRVASIARVEGASMQPSLNPPGGTTCDIVLLNRWSVRNYEVQRGDIISLVSPRNPEQKIIKRVIALEGDIIKTMGYRNRYIKIPSGHLWIEGDHHGHSFDSNVFGPASLGLVHARASHIIWPPSRWMKLQAQLPERRRPLMSQDDEWVDEADG